MRTGVNQSLDIQRYKKYTIDLNSKDGNPGDSRTATSGVFDLRKSMKVESGDAGKIAIDNAQQDVKRLSFRNMTALRKEKLLKQALANNMLTSAGVASSNFNKPFSFV